MIGVGLYSMAGVYGSKDPAELEKMLLRALELGVDYFDVAPGYGQAESFLGRILRPFRDQVQIATKGGISPEGKADGSYQGIREGCKMSLQKLQVEYIDHYQVHFADPETPVKETVQALEDLKQEGWIGEYGLGHFSREKIKEFCYQGSPSTLMLEISPLNLGDYFRYRDFNQEAGLKLIAMGVTGRGYLAGKTDREDQLEQKDIRRLDSLFYPDLARWREGILHRLKELGDSYGKEPVQVAINWVSTRPGVHRILIGPSREDHLEMNLGALGWSLEKEDQEYLDNFLLDQARQHHKKSLLITIAILENKKPSSRDLIFALESLFSLGIMEEKEAGCYFRQVMSAVNESGLLEKIKEQLKTDYLSSLQKIKGGTTVEEFLSGWKEKETAGNNKNK